MALSPEERAVRLQSLRASLPNLVAPKPRESSFFGKLHEIYGACGGGKTEAVVDLLLHEPLPTAWVEAEWTLYPPCLGKGLSSTLFIDAGPQIFWAAQQILKSGLFQRVVLHRSRWAAIELRRLQLLAEQSQAAVFLLTPQRISEARFTLDRSFHVTRCGGKTALQCELRRSA